MSELKRYCFTLDLKSDPKLISEYEKYHQSVWPEIKKSILDSGIEKMEIYRVANRLFMIMEVNESFSFEKKNAMDKSNTKVQEWETLMWKYQDKLSFAKEGEKWVLMQKIFDLNHW